MADDADRIGLLAGDQDAHYTFWQAGTLEYACHTDGHDRAGMKGTITVG